MSSFEIHLSSANIVELIRCIRLVGTNKFFTALLGFDNDYFDFLLDQLPMSLSKEIKLTRKRLSLVKVDQVENARYSVLEALQESIGNVEETLELVRVIEIAKRILSREQLDELLI